MLDKLGSPDTYNHYPTGWAVAFSTPFRMFKRYSYQGGVCDPLVIHWPKGIAARGEVRDQYHHCTDIVPTILECCGDRVAGHGRSATSSPRCPGVSMRYTFDAPRRADEKQIQYYEMLGTRGIWHEGLEGRDRARADALGQRPLRPGPLAALPHRRGPRPRRTTSPSSTPRR